MRYAILSLLILACFLATLLGCQEAAHNHTHHHPDAQTIHQSIHVPLQIDQTFDSGHTHEVKQGHSTKVPVNAPRALK